MESFFSTETSNDALPRVVPSNVQSYLSDALTRACEKWNIEYYCLKANLFLADGASRSIKITNYPEIWLSRYTEAGYARIDPAANYALDHVRLASLQSLLMRMEASKLKDSFIDDAKDLGVDGGVTVPIQSPYLSGFVNFNYTECIESVRFLYFAVNFTSTISEMLGVYCKNADREGGYHSLTNREKQVAFWASHGKTAWETAMILGISKRTVVAHVGNGMSKIGCSNKCQMISRISPFLNIDPALDEFRVKF